MKVQCLLQKFTSCCIAGVLRMLHIKMFISNAVQKIIQTDKNGEFAGYVQIKQATNSLTSMQHFKWARFTASRILPLGKSSAAFRFLVSCQSSKV